MVSFRKTKTQNSSHGRKVALLETAPTGMKGSMSVYADMLSHYLRNSASLEGALQVRRINLAPPNRLLQRCPTQIRSLALHGWLMARASVLLPWLKADLVHIIDGSYAYIKQWLPALPVVATSHDIIPLLQLSGGFPVPPPGRFAAWIINRSVRELCSADRIVADSRSTRDDLLSMAGANSTRIRVVNPAIPQQFRRYSIQENRDRGGETKNDPSLRYVFHIGNNGFYKNREAVLKIFNRFGKSIPLKLKMAGPPPSHSMIEMVRELGLAEKVEFIIDPEDKTVAELYRSASLFLFPSRYEGFGWPPLEAMLHGCPVVCSTAGSLPEVVGDAALTAPADDIDGLDRLCLRVLKNNEVASDLIQRGRERVKRFSLERMGEGILAVYREVLGDVI